MENEQNIVVVNNPAHNPVPMVVSSNDDEVKRFGKKRLAVLIVLSLVVLLFLGLAAATWAVAYDKLKINDVQTQRRVAHLVQGVSFTPKTNRFLMESVALAHQKVTRFAWDFSVAVDSDILSKAVGNGHGDFAFKGAFDYANLKAPKGYFSMTFGEDAAVDFKGSETTFYLKLTKIPTKLLEGYYGAAATARLRPLFDNWVEVEGSEAAFNSEARQEMRKEEEAKGLAEFGEYATAFLDDDDFMKKFDQSREMVDGTKMYKLKLDLTAENIEYIVKKLQQVNGSYLREYQKYRVSDFIKDASLTFWVESGNYYVRKVALAMTILPQAVPVSTPTNVLGVTTVAAGNDLETAGPVKVAAVLMLSNFGREVTVDVPSKKMKLEEFMGAYSAAITGLSAGE